MKKTEEAKYGDTRVIKCKETGEYLVQQYLRDPCSGIVDPPSSKWIDIGEWTIDRDLAVENAGSRALNAKRDFHRMMAKRSPNVIVAFNDENTEF